jgi:hypothetical protein
MSTGDDDEDVEPSGRAAEQTMLVLDFDAQGVVVRVNPRSVQALGDVSGRTHHSLLVPADVHTSDSDVLWRQLKSGTTVVGRLEVLCVGERRVVLQTTYTPTVVRGRPRVW